MAHNRISRLPNALSTKVPVICVITSTHDVLKLVQFFQVFVVTEGWVGGSCNRCHYHGVLELVKVLMIVILVHFDGGGNRWLASAGLVFTRFAFSILDAIIFA